MAEKRGAAADLLCQELDIAACCKGYKLKAILVLPDDVQSLCPNGPCSVPLSREHLLACDGPEHGVWLKGSITAKASCQATCQKFLASAEAFALRTVSAVAIQALSPVSRHECLPVEPRMENFCRQRTAPQLAGSIDRAGLIGSLQWLSQLAHLTALSRRLLRYDNSSRPR